MNTSSMRLAFGALVALGLAISSDASAAYPNGGIHILSQGGGGSTTSTLPYRSINTQLTRQNGFIFATHQYNAAFQQSEWRDFDQPVAAVHQASSPGRAPNQRSAWRRCPSR